MDQGVQIDITSGLVSIDVHPFHVFALVVLLIAFTLRRQSLSDRGKWDKAWDPIPPSLKESPAPMVTAWRAWSSLLSSLWKGILWIVFLALALDLALLRGAASLYVWDNLGIWLNATGQFLRTVLVRIASFMLGSS